LLVVVPATSKIQTFGDLLAAARSSSLNAGSSGNGTPPHLTLALFNDTAKTKIQHVPYKGGAPAMTDLVGGQLDVVFSNFPESFPHVKSGKLTGSWRSRASPAIRRCRRATTSEAGMPALLVENWTAVMVPGGTPDLIVDKLDTEIVKIMLNPELEERAGRRASASMRDRPASSRPSSTMKSSAGARSSRRPTSPQSERRADGARRPALRALPAMGWRVEGPPRGSHRQGRPLSTQAHLGPLHRGAHRASAGVLPASGRCRSAASALRRLHAADDADQWREHAERRAGGLLEGRVGWKDAGVARRLGIAHIEDRNLTVEPDRGPETSGLACATQAALIAGGSRSCRCSR
jgi:hypothetical protein